MYLKFLYLKNFRNHQKLEVHFTPTLNIFYGENGQGKTNLLEALYFIATGRSFRTQHLSELICFGASFFFLEAQIEKDGVKQNVKLSFDGQNKQLQIDGHYYSSFHPLLGILPFVLYAPMDMELISGSPAQRRRFLNLHLAQSDPLYVHHLTRFWRAMKQRNCLLRNKNQESLDCWEMEMVQSSEYIVKARQKMIEELQKPLQSQSKQLASENESSALHFHVSQSKNYLQQLQKNRPKEMQFGFTLIGPHRDDFSLSIDEKPARLFASEGQKKTAIAALKFAEWERLCNQIGGKALMGIDDFGLHLDEARQGRLRDALENFGQVFITTPQLVPDHKNFQRNLRPDFSVQQSAELEGNLH